MSKDGESHDDLYDHSNTIEEVEETPLEADACEQNNNNECTRSDVPTSITPTENNNNNTIVI